MWYINNVERMILLRKGKVFISSTIYDFKDLRSALKYWLTEMGYEVFESETSDFPRDSAQNSYETCLSTIEKCDWFILLIGNRVGGTLKDDETEDTISITRKEYRTAYNLFKAGKIKKIITFVRDDVWQEKEIRKKLSISIPDVSKEINGCSTDNIENPEAIFSFIDEVRRVKDIKESDRSIEALPKGNWINIFSDFSEIVNTLNIELNINGNVSDLIWKANLKRECIKNLQKVFTENDGYFRPFYKVLTEVRNTCVSRFQDNNRAPITISATELNIFCITFITPIKFSYNVIQDALKSGFFLDFDPKNNCYNSGCLDNHANALKELIEINNDNNQYFDDAQIKLLRKRESAIRNHLTNVEVSYDEIGFFLAMHDRIENIKELALYLFSKVTNLPKEHTPQLYPFRLADNFVSDIPENIEYVFGKEVTYSQLETYLLSE